MVSVVAVVAVGAALESGRPRAEPEKPEVRIPVDLEDGLSELMRFDSEFIAKFRALESEEETYRLHFSTGMWLRNNWGLWGEETGEAPTVKSWFIERGIQHPDTMSTIILICLWRRLNGRVVDAEAFIRKIHNQQPGPNFVIDDAGRILDGCEVRDDERLVEELFKWAEKCRDLEHPQEPSEVEIVFRVDPAAPWRAGRRLLAAFRNPAVRIYRVSFEMDDEDDPIAVFLPIAFAPPGDPEERTCEFPGRVEVAVAAEPFDTNALAASLGELKPTWKSVPAILRPADDVSAGTVLRAFEAMLEAGAKWVVILEPTSRDAPLVSIHGKFVAAPVGEGDSPPTRLVGDGKKE